MKQSRYYEKDGKMYPSVTTILSVLTTPKLLSWQLEQASVGGKVSETALDVGTVVHKAISEYVKRAKIPNTDKWGFETKSCWQAFMRWHDTEKPRILSTEETVFNPTDVYAGSYDAVAILRGKLTLIDFKSSSSIRTPYWLQLAAYAKCIPNVEAIGIVRLDKFLSEYEEDIRDINSEYYEMFKKVHELWQWIEGEEGRDVTNSEIVTV